MTLKTINLRNRISLDVQQEREVKTMIILLSVFVSALIFGISLSNQNKEIIADVFNNINKDSDVFTDIFIKSFFVNIFNTKRKLNKKFINCFIKKHDYSYYRTNM